MSDIDPTASTSASLNRGAFVGLGAGAALAAGVPGLAKAEMGKPHDPIVPENDPSIVVFRPLLQSSGRWMDAYAAVPKEASAATPGVVVTMHVWGVDAQIRDTVRRFAQAGYVTIAPDLYAGTDAPSGDGATDVKAFRPIFSQLKPAMISADLASAAQWIRTRLPADASKKAKVGLTGFCGGGHMALTQTITDPAPYQAAAIWYGAVASLDPAKVGVPTLGSYGQRDTGIPAADVTTFFAAITDAHDLKIYPEAGHAFFDDTRDRYVPSAAADAWKRTLHWFSYYLLES